MLSSETARLSMAPHRFIQIAVATLLVLVQGGPAILMAPLRAGTILGAVAPAGLALSGWAAAPPTGSIARAPTSR